MAADKEVSFVVRVKDAASAALKDIQKAGEGVTEKLFGFKDILKELTAAAAAFSLAELVKDMMDLGVAADKTFRQIASNLPTFTEGLNDLKEGIEEIADASGRSIEGMEKSAAAIAKMGVANASELKQQLEAATLLADATGNDVDTMAQLLIQLRREFHLTGDEALDTAAKLAAAGRGKIDIAELFSAFQASAPIFQKFHIDVDTATNAIVSMVAQGYGLRQIRAQLNGLDAEGIREWAKQAHAAGDAMGELQQRADEVRGSTSALYTKLKNEFNQSLEDLGLRVLPIVNAALLTMTGLLQTAKDALGSTSFAGLGVTPGMRQALGLPETFSGHGSTRTFGGDAPGTANPFTPPISEADKKKIEEAAIAEAKLRVELQDLARQSEETRLKTLELAKAQGETLKQAIDQALGALVGGAAEEALRAIDERAAKLEKEILLNQALTVDEKQRYLNEVEQIREIERLQSTAKPILQRTDLTLSSVGAPGQASEDLTRLMRDQQALLDIDRQIVAVGGDDSAIKQKLLEIDKQRAAILKGLIAPAKDEGVIAKQTTQDIRDQAYAIQQAVDGAVQLGEAFGVVSQTLGNVARSLGQITAGMGPLLDQIKNLGSSDANGKPLATIGSVIGAALPVVGAVATLGSTILGLGSASDQAARQVRALADSLIQSVNSFADEVEQNIAGYGNTLAQQLEAAANKYQELKTQIQGSDVSSTLKAELLSQLNGLEAERVQQIKDEYAAQQALSQQDYEVRKLRAEGLNDEADALAFAEQQQREYAKAVKDGADEATLAALKETQAAEAAQHEQQVAAQAQQALLNQLLQAEQNQLTTAQQSLAATQQLVQTLASYSKSLVLNTGLTTLSPASQVTTARKQLQDLFAAAMGGDKNAAGQFTQSADAFLQSSRSYNASGAGYVSDFSSVQDMLGALTDKYGTQESVEQQQVDAAQQQVDILKQLLAAVQGGTAALVESIRQQSEASLAGVSGVLAQLGALSGTLSAVGQSITSAEHDTLVGDQDAVRLASEQEVAAMNAGASAQTIAQLDQVRQLELMKSAQDSYYAQQLIATAKTYGWDSPQVQAIIDLQTKYDAGVQSQIDAINISATTIAGTIRAASGQGNDTGVGSHIGSGGRLSPDSSSIDPVSPMPYVDTSGLDLGYHTFASGGDFPGGFGLFGEAGPELALAGPARIFTAAQTRDIFSRLGPGAASDGRVYDAICHLADVVKASATDNAARLDSLIAKSDQHATQLRRGFERLGARTP